MIIGVIGNKASGKETFSKILQSIDPNIKIERSIYKGIDPNTIVNRKENTEFLKVSDKKHLNIYKNIEPNSCWLEKHKQSVSLIKSADEEMKRQLESLSIKNTKKAETIKDRVRNLENTVIILDFTLDDYYLLQNKAPFRLVNIIGNDKRRYSNFKIKKDLEKNTNDTSTTEYYKEFFDESEEFYNKYKYHLFKSTITYNISNNSDLDTFKLNINNFWKYVTTKYRPSWDDYFMSIALHLADRSNCIKLKVGALAQKDCRIISTGFNGTPKGILNCYEGGCPRCHSNERQGKNLDKCSCIHAEENCIAFGKDNLANATLYVTYFPCTMCAKIIIQSDISKIWFMYEYDSDESKALFEEKKIEVRQYIPDNLSFDSVLDNK